MTDGYKDSKETAEVDFNKLKDMMNKMEVVEQTVEAEVLEPVDPSSRSINWGIVAIGQGGSKIGQEFYHNGYPTICVNTAKQDLEKITVPDENKLLCDVSLGGTGKDLEIGGAAIEEYQDEIRNLIDSKLDGCEMIYVIATGGGGSGSGGCVPMLELLESYGRPLGMLYVLPMESEGSLTKYNTVTTLAKLAKMASTDKLNSLVIVDNAKIESIYPNLPQKEFWQTANKAIIEPLHLMNHLSSLASDNSLDAMDFGRVLNVGDCSLVGMMEVDNYMEELSIAEAVMNNLDSGLLASGFDLNQTRAAAVIVTGPKKVLSKLPAVNINYAFGMMQQMTGSADFFNGVFDVPSDSDSLKVYVLFSGLGLPNNRIEDLRLEAEKHKANLHNKEESRASNMTVDFGKEETAGKTEAIYQKIKKQKSGFGKLQNSGKVIDRRRK